MNTYYHNPRCTKSRAGLELVSQSGIPFKIKEYLKEPLTTKELRQIFEKLNCAPKDFVRKKEPVYKDLQLDKKNFSVKEWIQMVIENPSLFERPVLTTKTSAVVGRPTEKLEAFLKNITIPH